MQMINVLQGDHMAKYINSNWKEWFSPLILARGLDYFKNGAVVECEIENGYCNAVVSGGSDYDVEIEFEDGEVISMDCTCPYAEGFDSCKHEAAVLYYLDSEEIKKDESVREGDEKNSELRKMIDCLDENTAKLLLYDAALKNPSIWDDIAKKVPAGGLRKAYFDNLYNQAYGFIFDINNTMDDDYYDDYDDKYNAIHDLMFFLENNILPLANEKKSAFYCFSLASRIHDAIDFYSLIESDYYDFCSDILDLIRKIMDFSYKASDDKKEIERLARNKMQEPNSASIYREFLIYTVKDKELARKELDDIQKRDYSISIYPVDTTVRLMDVIGYKEDDIRQTLSEHLDQRVAQKMLAQRLLDNGEWEKCIDTIKYILCEHAGPRKNTECFSMLKNIYIEHGMKEELADLIYSDILQYHQPSLENIQELETLVSEERWNEICEELKKAPTMRAVMPDFLKSIKSDSDLMDWFEKNGSSSYCSYGRYLLPIFPERTISAYKRILEEEKKTLSDRNSYRRYVTVMEDLLSDTNGMDFVQDYVEELFIQYKRYPAFKDELRKMLKRNGLI